MKTNRYFNTEGICSPNLHYMVRLDDRLREIRQLYVDRGKYFVISRGRQYGKSTTLHSLAKYLRPDYLVLSMDFQEIGTTEYREENTFARAFADLFIKAFRNTAAATEAPLIEPVVTFTKNVGDIPLRKLFDQFSQLCRNVPKPIVLMIDEVDSAANNQVFLDFLSLLRRYYLDRENQDIFHSVILAGVYDIKNLKLKLRSDSEHRYNSPWNIAADFDIEMGFSSAQIAGMLQEYAEEHSVPIAVNTVSEEIFRYTSGYPYLVSAICKLLDEKIPGSKWNRNGIVEAVSLLLKRNTPLFDSMAKQLDIYPDLREMIEDILYQGKQISFSPIEKSVNLGTMFGFLKEENGYVVIANRIFEMVLLNLFMTEEAVRSEAFRYGQRVKNQFIPKGRLNMELILEKFILHFSDIYGENDDKFIEQYGRKLFLLYLKPIINGVGNFYIEAQTRDAGRTDVIVDYLGEQFVIELKIWHGRAYHERGEKQLAEYLDSYHLKKGYMLSFNFNKKKNVGLKTIKIEDKILLEAVV